MAKPAFVASVEERVIAGPSGDGLRLRLYRPERDGRLPVVVFYHGSGFVLCSLDTHDGMCRNLSAGAGCLVVSVDYRLAPEYPFPAGLNDCVHATRWVRENAEELGADPAQIAIAGDIAAAGTTDAPAVMESMRKMPVNDFMTRDGKLRIDGRLERDMYLFQVKSPVQSKGPWDYYTQLDTIPAKQATRPLSEGGCPLVESKPQ